MGKKKKRGSEPREQGSRLAQEEVAMTNPIQELWRKYGLQVVDDNMDLPPVRWIVNGLIEEKSPTTIVALPKVGKTWLQLQLALVIVLGGTFLGREVTTTGRVIYFCGEGHRTQVMKRVDALLKQMGKTRGQLRGRMLISDLAWHMGDTRHRAEQNGLTEAQTEVLAIVKDFKPVAIFVDPLTRFTKGENEDKSYEMSPITNFIQHKLCRMAAVIVGHHTDKKGTSARGTGDILGFVATELFLDGEPASNKFTVSTVMRNAEAPEPIEVRLDLKSVTAGGTTTLDTAEVVVQGSTAVRDAAQVRETLNIIRETPGITSSKLAKKLHCRKERANMLAILARAAKVPVRAKSKRRGWALPEDEHNPADKLGDIRDVDASGVQRAPRP